jgi:predicted secreted protein
MKLASLTAAIAVALVMAAALSSPAAACKWKKAGYRTADAGAVVGYRHGKHWKHGRHWKHRMIK